MHEDRTCVLTCTGDDCPCTGGLQLMSRSEGLYHVIPENDTNGSVLRPTNFPRRQRGSNQGPLAQEASALTTQLPWFPFSIIFILVSQYLLKMWTYLGDSSRISIVSACLLKSFCFTAPTHVTLQGFFLVS